MASDGVCFIVPPHVLVQMIEEGSPEVRTSAVNTLAISERVRERRAVTRRLVQHEPQAAAALLLACRCSATTGACRSGCWR